MNTGAHYFKNVNVGIGTETPAADLHVKNANPIVQIEGDGNAQLYVWGSSPGIIMSGNNPSNTAPSINMKGIDPQILLDAEGISYYPKIILRSMAGSGVLTTAGYGMAGGSINMLYGSGYGNQLGLTALGAVSYTEDPGHPVHTFIAPIAPAANIIEIKKVHTQGVSFTQLIIVDKEGNVGINTDTATARLHTKGTVRLEDLPEGEGDQVVMDAAGNLMRYNQANLLATLNTYAQQISDLQQQVAELQAQYAALTNG